MAKPLKRRLSISSDENDPIKDIVNLVAQAEALISITEFSSDKHNTHLVIKVKSYGKQTIHRNIYYNRFNLATFNMLWPQPISLTGNIIDNLSIISGHRFTEDDIEIIGQRVVAKKNSLGYFGEFDLNTYDTQPVSDLRVWETTMSLVKLKWTNISRGSFTQTLERKVGEGEWLPLGLTLELDPTAGPNGYKAEDADVVFAEDTTVYYRIVTENGGISTIGNEATVAVPASPNAVSDLSATFEP